MEATIDEPQTKRRKVRKGTRSCWECKGRKVRCTYMTPEQTVCDGCFRRATKCISQELPEHPLAPVDRRRQIGSRMVRVEALIESLVKRAGEESPDPGISNPHHGGAATIDPEKVGGPTPLSIGTAHTPKTVRPRLIGAEGSHHLPSPAISSAPSHGQKVLTPASPTLISSSIIASDQLETTELATLARISQHLLDTFPSQEFVNRIIEMAGPVASFFHQLVRKPYKDIHIGEKERREQLAELTIRHTSQTHPVIIARQMLLLAITFRYLHPDIHRELEASSEPPATIMKRLGDAAFDFITTNDSMMSTIDGLECLLLSSTYQADSGNLRSGWSIIRRTMVAAQLMCLHRQKRPPLKTLRPGNKWDPQFLWYRIVYYDRFFSLILGLPQGSSDSSMGTASPFEQDTPMGQLERRHCVLAGRILQRNDRDPSCDDLVDTQAIDMELRKLSESMPSKWWLVPDLASIKDDVQLFWETAKLTNQVFHYILLSHLHLPFLLRSSSGPDQHQYEYGRLACVNASRDLLNRYRVFRTFSRVSYCCHSMDFFAITASMTLILAHFDGHRSKRISDNALIHQRTSDRAIMEEILDNMEQVGTLNKTKTVSERGAGVLRQLLAIEADAAAGSIYRLDSGDDRPHDTRGLRLSIPYFGVIAITREDQGSRDANRPIHRETTTNLDASYKSRRNVDLQNDIPAGSASEVSPPRGPGYGADGAIAAEQSNAILPEMVASDDANFIYSFKEPVGDFTQAQPFDHGLIDSDETWELQGVDMSLFDSLMKEADGQVWSEGDFWWLQ
ncbi:hypothetical protein GQ53DRAFT_740573 [Thozetella sp. PMI_491]|nr:hypothetical protein GQ53DRAFT_740573 [Thozetella sp. PMI_491]